MSSEVAKRAAIEEFVAETEQTFPLSVGSDLEDALYTFNELRAWHADTEITFDDAVRAWALIEKLRQSGFPDELMI